MGRRIMTISAALLAAMLGTILVVAYVGRADARALAGVETVQVLVAKGDLKKGQTVKSAQDDGLVTTAPFPRKTVPSAALMRLTRADEALVFASDVTAGEILQRPRLVAATVAADKLMVPPGKLAVTVQLNDPARVANFVTVGSDIAIFDSYTVFEGNQSRKWTPSGNGLGDEFANNKATRVLLPRVKVLAVGESFLPPGEAESKDKEDKDKNATPDSDAAAPNALLTLVTVAVDQSEAEKLIHATQTGSLYVGLLGTYDVKPGPGVDNRTLFNR